MKRADLLKVSDFDSKSYNSISKGEHSIYVRKKIIDESYTVPIYRYLPFSFLIQLLREKKLYIPNRQRFSDIRELSEYHFKNIEELKCKLNPMLRGKQKSNYQALMEKHSQIWGQAVSCWTYDSHNKGKTGNPLDENYLMWQCHKGKKFVCRIRSSVQRIINSIDILSHDILISEIEYVPLLRRHIAHTPEDIFKKPEFYIDEQEVRMVALHNNKDGYIAKDCVRIPITPEMMIDEITLSPFIVPEEERILIERLKSILGDIQIAIKHSQLMEYFTNS